MPLALKILLVCVLIIFALWVFTLKVQLLPPKDNTMSTSTENVAQLKLAGQSFQVDVLRSDAQRANGLSGREKLTDQQGAFFIFEQPGPYRFWMKEMNFSIDIIWLDQALKVVDITKDAKPESFPRAFAPSSPAQYVLEINAGLSDKYGFKIADQAELLTQ